MPGEERLRTKILWVDKREATERILVNLFELREMLGDRLTAHLLRAMIWADRIVSASFADFTMRKEQAAGPGMVRNAETILMLVVGCLREAARAIDDAMKEGLGDLVPTTDPDMGGLLAIANRWNQDEDGRLVRNKMAFHVDSAELVRGIELLEAVEGHEAVLWERSPSQKRGEARFALAHRALAKGAFLDSDVEPLRRDRRVAGLRFQLEDANLHGSRVRQAYDNTDVRYGRVQKSALADLEVFEDHLVEVFTAACHAAAAGRVPTRPPAELNPTAKERLERLRQALQRERGEVPGEWPDDPLAQVRALANEVRRLRAASQRAGDRPERPGKKAPRAAIPELKVPKDCSDAEVAAFCCLVRQGGEVESKGLERRVRAAKALAILYVEDGALAGVAALKRPTTKHRDDVFGSAGTPKERAPYSLELGWVFVAEDHRGKGYSRPLVQAALSHAAEAPVFATTREDNGRMQTTLSRLGFQRLGNAWKSARGSYNLVLFVLTQQPATG